MGKNRGFSESFKKRFLFRDLVLTMYIVEIIKILLKGGLKMKLMKKIAPFAISALMLGATLGSAAALNIADWKTQFKASNTAVVVGTGVTNVGDIAAALHLAQAVGIDTTGGSSSVTGESYKFEKSSDKFNLGEGLDDIRGSLTNDHLPTILADGTYTDDNNDEFEYTQKITMAGGIDLTHFADKDYNSKEPTLGFHLAKDAAVLNYTLDFSEEPDCGTDMDSTTVTIMGKDYYISSSAADCGDITLLDSGESATVYEGETKTVGGKAVTVSYVGDTGDCYETSLTIDGKETNTLEEGDTYKIAGTTTYIGIKDIRYSSKETGKSSVILSVGKGKIYIDNGQTLQINDEDVDGLTGYLTNSTYDLGGLTLQWNVDEESFVTPTSEIVLPGFETVKIMMTGVIFPTGEETTLDNDGDTIAQITVPIKGGEQVIPLLEDIDTADGNFDVIGIDEEYLVTKSGRGTITLNGTADQAYFIATYYDGDKDAESYYFSFTTSEESGTDYVTIKDETTGDTCKKSGGNTCTFGEVELDIKTVDHDQEWFNVTAGTDVYFDRIFTEEGLWIYLPVNNASAYAPINLSSGGVGYKLVMIEEDEDGTLGGGGWINATYNFTASPDYYVQISDINATFSGGDVEPSFEDAEDEYVGYVQSKVATNVVWDKSGDQYVATINYYGEEVYGSAYIAGSASSGGSGSWAALQDSEASLYTGKNIIAIGGTAVNKVARMMLGLSEDTAVYGTEAGWLDNTNVDAAGKAILWLKDNPYTSDKYALLVAGYEGTDTEKAGNYLTLKGSTVAKDKIVIDTAAMVEAS